MIVLLFKDRTQAAVMLAGKLQWLKERWADSLVVLAIPRGGVVTGEVIANALGASLDVVVAKKVGDPLNSEFAIGAVMHDGSFIPNEDVISSFHVPKQYIEESVSVLKKEIDRRLIKFRGNKTYHLVGKVALLVDDGVATGTTMFAAIKWLKTQGLKKLMVATPVGPRDTIEKLKDIVDELIVLRSPSIFRAVGAFYKNFSQVTDDEVVKIMRKYRANIIPNDS
ncbi:MAG TPA: phosphoribosyltransferase family protein [Nitrososphaeraceae archaeon]|nr:phosphoribosyltransferase family protein [Nitrososphaeraceae archaeon]